MSANRVAEMRRKRGLAVSRLAEAAEVSRQTIYSIEAGLYAPNTTVAIKLARLLEASVEELFDAEASERRPRAAERAQLIAAARAVRAGEPVRLCQVGDRLIAVPPPAGASAYPDADGIVVEGNRAGRANVRVAEIRRREEADLVMAGCDPAMPLLADPLRRAGIRLTGWTANSSEALRLIRDGRAHVAGCHVKDPRTGEADAAFLRRFFADKDAARIGFVTWEEGLVVARGNPKGIRAVEDLGRADVRMANREPGSGTRRLIEALVKKAGLAGAPIRGFASIFPDHVAAAREVQEGRADCCVSVSSAARLLGLDFVPLETERYDFVIPKALMKTRAIETFVEEIARASLRRAFEEACGYEAASSGARLDG